MILNIPLKPYYFNKLNLKLTFICFFYGLIFCYLFDFKHFFGVNYSHYINLTINLLTIGSEIFFLIYLSKSARIKEAQWNLFSEFKLYLLLLLVISILLFSIALFFSIITFFFLNFLRVVIFVFFKGLFPISLLLLVKIYNSKKYLKLGLNNVRSSDNLLIESKDLNQGFILLSGKNKDEKFDFLESNIIYLKAEDNYVTVFFIKENNVEKVTLRSTLSEIEEQVLNSEFLVRCHRSYIVNIRKINRILGNARKYSLKINEVHDEIPLGFKYYNEVVFSFNKTI